MRLISSFGRVHQGHLRAGKMDADGMVKSDQYDCASIRKEFGYGDWLICTTANGKYVPVLKRIAKMHGGNLGCIMVDYLQLMKVPGMGW